MAIEIVNAILIFAVSESNLKHLFQMDENAYPKCRSVNGNGKKSALKW